MSIVVTPADQVLVIDGTTPAELVYQATGQFSDGSERDITAEVSFSLADPLLGTVVGSTVTANANRGGITRVIASAGSAQGSTSLTLRLERRHQDPGTGDLPGDPGELGDLFDGEDDPARAPSLVYPNDGVLLPPNLRKLELHYYPGDNNTLFEITFSNAITDVRVYTRCHTPLNGGCIHPVDAQLWSWLAQTNRGGPAVNITVRGTDDSGTAVGTSEEMSLSFSYDEIRGGIYYWTTSNNTGIMRFDFASTDQTEAEKFLGTELSDGTCIGCHALSRDGSKIVAEAGGQNDGRILLLDVSSKEPLVAFGTPGRSVFESWNPDGSQYVGVYGDSGAEDYNLLLFDGNSGAQLGTIDVGATSDDPLTHPDWSPDGSRIAYTRAGIAGTNQRMHKGAIEMVTDMGGVWSGPEVLVPSESGQNHYYPAFSPDGEYIVYNESRCSSGDTGAVHECDADTNPSAKLYMIRAEAGATPVELANANAPGVTDEGETNLTNSYPKWSPFVFQRTDEFGSRLEWLTFSSTRSVGLRGQPATGTLLWMVAVDPDRVGSGGDPSYPAFVLPFQDFSTSNHIAQWTQEVVPPVE